MSRSLIVSPLVVVALAACAAAPPPESRAHEDPCRQTVCVDASLDLAAAVVDVELRLPPGLGRVHLPFHEEPFSGVGDGYRSFASLEDGAPFPDEVSVGEDGLTLTYRVRLAHHEAGPTYGIDQVPHPTRGGWFLVGRAFMPVVKSAAGPLPEARLELTVKGGPEAPLVASVDLARERSAAALRDALYLAGEVHVERLRAGEVTVDVASSDFDPGTVARVREQVERLLGLATRRFGPLSSSRRLVVFDRTAQGFMGGVVGDGVSVLSSTEPTPETMTPLGSLLVHELMHLWFQGEERWLGEGFNVYAQLLMQTALDSASEADALAYFLTTVHEYLASVGERRIVDLDGDNAYPAGASLAFCVDVELRHQGSSFERVWRDFRAAPGPGRARGEAYLDFLAARFPDVGAKARAWLEEKGPIDVGACLARAGYRVTTERYAGYSLRALALEVVRSPSFSMQRAELFAVKEGSMFEAGDVIVDVDGRPLGRLTELSWLLAAHRAGDRVRFGVQRGGARIVVELELPEVDDAGRPEEVRLVASGEGAFAPFAPDPGSRSADGNEAPADR